MKGLGAFVIGNLILFVLFIVWMLFAPYFDYDVKNNQLLLWYTNRIKKKRSCIKIF